MTKAVTLLIDTFCATNCDYCEMATRAKNKFKLPYDQLTPYMDIVKPVKIVIFAGDTFYDHENIEKAYRYATSLPYVKTISSVSEIQKFPRDYGIRKSMAFLCSYYGKKCGVELSLDLSGSKTGDFSLEINQFIIETGIIPNLSMTVTVNDINQDGLINLKKLINQYDKLQTVIPLGIVLDYNAVTTNLLNQEKLKGFVEFVVNSQNTPNKLFIHLKPNFCTIRSGMGDLINQEGNLSMCGKVRPEYDLKPINVLSIKTADDYEKFIQLKHEFKIKADSEICEKCEAKHICGRCPKFLDLNKNFDGTSDVCLFYKIYHNITKR